MSCLQMMEVAYIGNSHTHE